ncbi:hypothetical protein [uncultured Algibacter sp.]|uniref:hypothetical protein n=1 Tax=uncultured Algibacter sp. TaxID=298659 RepID=UPI0032178320
MKTLKITLITALFFASLTSCTEQDLNEDNVLADDPTTTTEEVAPITGGVTQDD